MSINMTNQNDTFKNLKGITDMQITENIIKSQEQRERTKMRKEKNNRAKKRVDGERGIKKR